MKRKEMALLGTARLTVKPDAPAMVKTQVKQNLGGQDPERAQTGVILTHFDKEWETGRIGQWIRAYRPDLLPRERQPLRNGAVRPEGAPRS